MNKFRRVRDFLRTITSDAIVLEARSYQAAIRLAVEERPDAIILDMSMPTYDISVSDKGGRMKAYAGRDILRQMKRRGLQSKVIVLTQFESFGEREDVLTLPQLRDALAAEFSGNYIGTVFYNPSESGWMSALSQALRTHFQLQNIEVID